MSIDPTSQRPLIYVAGPYTSPDPCINTNSAIMVGNELLKRGYIPFIPHLTHFWHTITPKSYEDWMAYDSYWLDVCHGLFRIPGYSSGADREEVRAKQMGIPIFHDYDSMGEYFQKFMVKMVLTHVEKFPQEC